MAWSTESGEGKSPLANWANWAELFSSATWAEALTPVAVTGLGSMKALVFMFESTRRWRPRTPCSW